MARAKNTEGWADDRFSHASEAEVIVRKGKQEHSAHNFSPFLMSRKKDF